MKYLMLCLLMWPLMALAEPLAAFIIQHDGLLTDGQAVDLADLNATVECGANETGPFDAIALDIVNLALNNGVAQTVPAPDLPGVWCRASVVRVSTDQRSDYSNTLYLDFPDIPTPPAFQASVIIQ